MIHLTKKYFLLIAKGFCMGAADIVPGVSGGTMAFILGIYEELIDAIRLFGQKKFWNDILRGKFHHAFTLPKWGFLLSIASGILLAAAMLAKPLEHVLATNPVALWSFFFGLVLASIAVVARRVPKWSGANATSLIAGTVVAYIIVGLVPVGTPEAPWFLVLSGAIAICAMILPGISGSFLLVLLGKYEFILSAVNNRDVTTLAYVGIGAVVGIIAFSQVLGWLFRRYHDLTVALLTGFMIGSLRKIWPWEESADVGQVLGLMLLGAALVICIEYLAHHKSR